MLSSISQRSHLTCKYDYIYDGVVSDFLYRICQKQRRRHHMRRSPSSSTSITELRYAARRDVRCLDISAFAALGRCIHAAIFHREMYRGRQMSFPFYYTRRCSSRVSGYREYAISHRYRYRLHQSYSNISCWRQEATRRVISRAIDGYAPGGHLHIKMRGLGRHTRRHHCYYVVTSRDDRESIEKADGDDARDGDAELSRELTYCLRCSGQRVPHGQ